jgi:hypothetical protein
MSSSKTPPDIAKVRLTSEKVKKACLEMEQAVDELEQALLQLEAEAQAHKPVKK